MRWLKTLLLLTLILAVVNGGLLYNLYRIDRSAHYLDETMVDRTVSLLAQSGITVDKGRIPRKITVLPLCEGKIEGEWEDYDLRIAMRLSGDSVAENFSLHMMVNGLKISNSVSGDQFVFYDGDRLSFSYQREGNEVWQDALDAFMQDESRAQYRALTESETDRARRQLGSALGYGTDEKKKEQFSLRVEEGYRTPDGAYSVLRCVQLFDGFAISNCEAVFLLSGGRILCASGAMLLIGSVNDYAVTLRDQLNILFSEREEQPSPADDESQTDGETVLERMELLYSVSFSSDFKTVYLIPAWRMTYRDGSVSVRSALDGSRL